MEFNINRISDDQINIAASDGLCSFFNACRDSNITEIDKKYIGLGKRIEKYEKCSLAWIFWSTFYRCVSIYSSSYADNWHNMRGKEFTNLVEKGVIRLNFSTRRNVKLGLPNIGNSCYINSALQLLLAMDGKELERVTGNIENKQLRQAFYNVWTTAMQEDTTEEAMIPLLNNFRQVVFKLGNAEFEPNDELEQQDSSALLNLILGDSPSEFQVKRTAKIQENNEEIEPLENIDRVSMISIPAINGSFQNSFMQFCNDETNDPNNAISMKSKIDESSRNVSHYTTTQLLNATPPNYMVFSLKRFEMVSQKTSTWIPEVIGNIYNQFFPVADQDDSFRVKKINAEIILPKQQMDISPFVTEEMKSKHPNSLNYEVVGVINHQGDTARSGHYVADVKKDGNWLHCDDDTVTDTNFESLDNHNSYVVLFKKVAKTSEHF